ncbi:uncharacterized protein LOC110928726 isoform X2 [Helianthus annuus]|uniref:uncharacterized protein LOC110928726 isoform X2 n=1 Tax=Helianthus annuus TaxID=4232 RepID=UPI000B907CD6|nr:uncharacterized protein LOC110928726 isoform X2 [Helianthus annuus]XP_035843335.1 uncharacterized protein LOC110928726 isoform X2 [Helianthus annuus]
MPRGSDKGDGACSFFARIESTFEFHSPATLSVSFQAEPRLDFSLPSWSPSSSQEAHVLKKKNELLFQNTMQGLKVLEAKLDLLARPQDPSQSTAAIRELIASIDEITVDD